MSAAWIWNSLRVFPMEWNRTGRYERLLVIIFDGPAVLSRGIGRRMIGHFVDPIIMMIAFVFKSSRLSIVYRHDCITLLVMGCYGVMDALPRKVRSLSH